ncbi:MAG: glycosyltransferase [Hydrogenophilaceae bacterium]|nr:glycosyltransferase [Hydrogenophilaceae bacterium]
MNNIMLVLPVPIRFRQGVNHIESQAANGLKCWSDNFDRLVVACPVLPESEVPKRSSWEWVPEPDLGNGDRIRLVGLPWAHSVRSFLAGYRPVRHLLRHEIANARYLQFAIGGLIGDWASVAAREAYRMGRPYAVWTDRVESEVVRITADVRSPGKKQLALLHARLMKGYERYIIRRARLGLFHGAETFEAYAGLTEYAFLTHDVHTKGGDLISRSDLDRKMGDVLNAGRPLRIGYAGRASAMKAPLDWLAVLARLKELGVAFEATWLGDGEMLPEMRAYMERQGLSGHVRLPGFVSDRKEVLAFLRDCDLLLFTHITPESPRIILEALICATPVVGYANGYVADVVAPEGRQLLVPLGDTARLADVVAGLGRNRQLLADGVASAAVAGQHFSDEAVFRHRSELIKQYL